MRQAGVTHQIDLLMSSLHGEHHFASIGKLMPSLIGEGDGDSRLFFRGNLNQVSSGLDVRYSAARCP